MLFSDSWVVQRIVFESKRLDQAEEEAEEDLERREAELLAAQDKVRESLSRLRRLRKQKRLVVTKGHDMIRRGLDSLDELERVEAEESAAVEAVPPAEVVEEEVDWAAILGEPLDPALFGGTPAEAAGTSGGA